MDDDDGPRFIVRKEVVRLVRVSYSTVHKMMKRGDFPRGYKAGCRTMWRYDEVIEWIKSRPHAP